MAKVQKYFPHVGLPNNVTGVMQSGATPVADTIGQIAGVAGDFAQKYQAAQYASDSTEAELEIKKRVNSYHENLRVNPIKQVVGEDIVQTKEDDWNTFSKDLQDNYIGGIKNSKLKEDLSQWWLSASEDGRANVAESAMDENISYMGDKQLDHVNEFVSLKDYGGADTANRYGLESGFWGREQYDKNNDYIDTTKASDEAIALTDGKDTTYSDGVDSINRANLSVSGKSTAMNTLDAHQKEIELQQKEQLKATQEQELDTLGLRASTGQIISIDQYDQEVLSGEHASLTHTQDEWVRGRIRLAQNERERLADGGTISSSKQAEELIDKLMRTPGTERPDVLGLMFYLGPKVSTDLYEDTFNRMDKPAFKPLNDTVNNFVDNQLDAMEKDVWKDWDELDIINARARIENVIKGKLTGEHLSEFDIATEAGFTQEDADKLFYNERQKVIGFSLDKVTTLRETGGDEIYSNPEKLIQFGIEGRLYGQTQENALGQFILDESMTADGLRELAAKKYGSVYKELSKDQKAQVNLTASVGNLLRLTKDQFTEDFPGINGVLAVDPGTGLPAIHTRYEFTSQGQTETRDRIYRLNYDKPSKEEVWEYYSEQDRAWVPDPSSTVPDLHKLNAAEKAIDGIKTSYQSIKDLDPDPVDESAKILAEFQRAERESLQEADDGSILGNALKGAWGWIFNGKE